MKFRLKKGEYFRFKIDNIALQGVVMRKTIDQVGRVKNQVGIGVVNSLVVIVHFDFPGIEKQGEKIKRPLKRWPVNRNRLIERL